MNAGQEIAVLHLIRAGNPSSVLAAFLESYHRYPAGAPHRLIMLLKGFENGVPTEIDALLASVLHDRIHCPDIGFDIGSYVYGAESLSEPFVMLTNSFTAFAGDCWLDKLVAAIMLPGMGAVGATGSWESLSGRFLHELPDISRPWPARWARRLKALGLGVGLLALFPEFPNIHLRTNALLIRRHDLIVYRPALIRWKIQAWMFESGRWSLSRRLIRRGLTLAVVGRDGKVYAPEEWHHSGTFWQGDQENLLIHDNQTRQYDCGSDAFRDNKRSAAWAGGHPTAAEQAALAVCTPCSRRFPQLHRPR